MGPDQPQPDDSHAAIGHLSDHEVAYLESMPKWSDVSGADIALRYEAVVSRLQKVEAAARDLYEQVQMDESVGVCLSDRVACLRLGDLLVEVLT